MNLCIEFRENSAFELFLILYHYCVWVSSALNTEYLSSLAIHAGYTLIPSNLHADLFTQRKLDKWLTECILSVLHVYTYH